MCINTSDNQADTHPYGIDYEELDQLKTRCTFLCFETYKR